MLYKPEPDEEEPAPEEIEALVERIESGEEPTYPIEMLWDMLDEDDGAN